MIEQSLLLRPAQVLTGASQYLAVTYSSNIKCPVAVSIISACVYMTYSAQHPHYLTPVFLFSLRGPIYDFPIPNSFAHPYHHQLN